MNDSQHALIYDVNRSIMRLRMAYEGWCRSRGITYVQMLVLYTLRDEPRCTQKFISEHYLLPKQIVHNTVLRMAEAGLVRLESGDGREKHIVLTDQGKTWAESLTEELTAIETEVLECAGEQQVAQMNALFMYYDDLLEDAFGRCDDVQCRS